MGGSCAVLSVQKCLKRGSGAREREGGSIVDEGRGCRRERERGTVGECNRAEINQLATAATVAFHTVVQIY